MKENQRILVIAPSHPNHYFTDAAVAAWLLYQEYTRHERVGAALFLAPDLMPEGAQFIYRHSGNEYLWTGPNFGLDSGGCPQKTMMQDNLRIFLKYARPDVIHIHQQGDTGLELVELIRHFDPAIRIYVSLHDISPVCHRLGNTRASQGRCDRPDACYGCDPLQNKNAVWKKRRAARHFLNLADGVFTQSNFLQNFYLDAGIDPSRLYSMENCGPEVSTQPVSIAGKNSGRGKFCYFGPITEKSGIGVLLHALVDMQPEEKLHMLLTVCASACCDGDARFMKDISEQREKLEKQRKLNWVANFALADLDSYLADTDWVLVPALWEESSPVAIQAAFAACRPVLASFTEAISEKVEDGVNGVLARMGRPVAGWQNCLKNAAGDQDMWMRLQGAVTPPETEAIVNQHLEIMGVCPDPWQI